MSAFSNFVGREPCGIETVLRSKISFKDSSEELMRARRNFSILGFRTFRHSNLLLMDMMKFIDNKKTFLSGRTIKQTFEKREGDEDDDRSKHSNDLKQTEVFTSTQGTQ